MSLFIPRARGGRDVWSDLLLPVVGGQHGEGGVQVQQHSRTINPLASDCSRAKLSALLPKDMILSGCYNFRPFKGRSCHQLGTL